VCTLILIATCLLQSCAQEPGRVYQRPIAEAHAILAKTGLPPEVFGSADLDFSVDLRDPARVTWIVTEGRVEILRYDAELTAASDTATRVNLTLHAPSSGAHGDIAARLDSNPSVRNLYLAAMEESVASNLEDRPFNMATIYPQMMTAAVANIPRLQASADEAAAASARLERENVDRAYGEEAAGKRH
jgi:hypothetical protein